MRHLISIAISIAISVVPWSRSVPTEQERKRRWFLVSARFLGREAVPSSLETR
jgi:hypothetical protein